MIEAPNWYAGESPPVLTGRDCNARMLLWKYKAGYQAKLLKEDRHWLKALYGKYRKQFFMQPFEQTVQPFDLH